MTFNCLELQVLFQIKCMTGSNVMQNFLFEPAEGRDHLERKKNCKKVKKSSVHSEVTHTKKKNKRELNGLGPLSFPL